MRTALAAVVATLLAAAATWAVLAGPFAPPEELAVDDLIAISNASEQFTQALLTYDSEDLEASRQALEQVATESFLDLYERTFEGGLAGSIGETGSRAEATIREVYVGPTAVATGSAVVVFDATISSDDGSVRTLTGVYIRLDLVRDAEAGWLVDELTTLTAEGADVQ